MTSNQNKEVQCLHVRQLRASLMMRDVCMLSKHNRAQSSLQTETDVRWTSVERHISSIALGATVTPALQK